MAHYVILDSTANLVESFDDEEEAREALEQMVQQDPDEADDYGLLQYDDNGNPVGEVLMGSDLGVHA